MDRAYGLAYGALTPQLPRNRAGFGMVDAHICFKQEIHVCDMTVFHALDIPARLGVLVVVAASPPPLQGLTLMLLAGTSGKGFLPHWYLESSPRFVLILAQLL